MSELWTPYTEHERTVAPDVRKDEGGSYFDDELDTERSHREAFNAEMNRLVDHINKRPDHVVYVGSMEERGKMREVFNAWNRAGLIRTNPNIRIEYGIREGAIRVAE